MLARDGDDLGARLTRLVRDDRLVIGVVQRRADVVGHAAVHRHVLADARQRFQNAHRVQRHARRGHQAAARLGEQARLGHAELLARRVHRRRDRFGELVDGSRLVVGRVGDAQAAAHVQLLYTIAVPFLDARHKLHHDLDGLRVGMQREYLRADVAVQTRQPHVRGRQHVLHAPVGEVVAHGEAELRVLATRADVLMGVGLDTRRDAHVNRLHDAQLARDLGDALELDAAVDDDAANARLDGFAQLARRFIVAVHEDALGREARGQRDGQLAAA